MTKSKMAITIVEADSGLISKYLKSPVLMVPVLVIECQHAAMVMISGQSGAFLDLLDQVDSDPGCWKLFSI